MTVIPEMRGRERDLRLDLFRGLANWAIFLDHIPNNAVAWLTARNDGFSDAAELFVFISGYTAAQSLRSAALYRFDGGVPAASLGSCAPAAGREILLQAQKIMKNDFNIDHTTIQIEDQAMTTNEAVLHV